jgi:hypothetical protein
LKLFDEVTGHLKGAVDVKEADGLKGPGIEGGLSIARLVVGSMSHEELTQMVQAEGNIARQDEIMNTAARRALAEQAAGAKADVQAATSADQAAQLTAANTVKAQRDTLDQLAALEQEHSSTHVFQEMQHYDDQVRTMGDEVHQQTDSYLKTLRNSPLGDAGALSQRVGGDIKDNEVYGPRDETWTSQARSTQGYLNQLERWQQGEVAATNQIRGDLAQDKHLDPISQTMSDVDKALGGANSR